MSDEAHIKRSTAKRTSKFLIATFKGKISHGVLMQMHFHQALSLSRSMRSRITPRLMGTERLNGSCNSPGPETTDLKTEL